MNMSPNLISLIALALFSAFATAPLYAERSDDRNGVMPRKAPDKVRPDSRRAPESRPQPRPDLPHRTTPPPRPSERGDLRRDVPRATPPGNVPRARDGVREPRKVPPVTTTRPKPPAGYVLDKRHSHDRYYPPRGHIVPTLPPEHRRIVHRGVHYHYHHGVWYRPHGTRFIVVMPPFGIIVPFLPPFFTVVWVGAVPYYYAGGVYYHWYPDYHYYVVVEPPPAEKIRETPPGSDDLFIYPKEGQSAEQQARDRYECHRWAVDQTGFDPTLPGGNVRDSLYDSKRADYRRAMKACLEARGYSVQ